MTRPGAAAFPSSALEAARSVDLLILDVDGVMTDGRLYYADPMQSAPQPMPPGSPSEQPLQDSLEIKAFYAQDGAAIKMLQAAGIPVAIISGRASGATARRARELGIAYAYQGVDDKTAALGKLCEASGIAAERMAHAGDDIPDLPLFDRVGMRLSVADAHPEVTARADYVTAAAGGAGAVREICHLILIARGLWESALAAAGASPQ